MRFLVFVKVEALPLAIFPRRRKFMKKTERTKKALSGLLALSLALGCLPMPAHAQEEKLSTKSFFSAMKQQEPVETPAPTEPPVPETTAPAEPTEPAVPETTAPADPTEATEPAVSEPTEATEPAIPETTAPAEPTEPQAPVVAVVSDNVAGSLARTEYYYANSFGVAIKLTDADGRVYDHSFSKQEGGAVESSPLKASVSFSGDGFRAGEICNLHISVENIGYYFLELRDVRGPDGAILMSTRDNQNLEKTKPITAESGFRVETYGNHKITFGVYAKPSDHNINSGTRPFTINVRFQGKAANEGNQAVSVNPGQQTLTAPVKDNASYYTYSWKKAGSDQVLGTGRELSVNVGENEQYVCTIKRNNTVDLDGCLGSDGSWTYTVTGRKIASWNIEGLTKHWNGQEQQLLNVSAEGAYVQFMAVNYGSGADVLVKSDAEHDAVEREFSDSPVPYKWLTYAGTAANAKATDSGTYKYFYQICAAEGYSLPDGLSVEWNPFVNSFAGGDCYYGTVTATIIGPAEVAKAPTAVSPLVFNGADQALIHAGTAQNGTMQYKLDNGEWSTEIPKARLAKTYTVHYRAKGTNGSQDSAEGSLQVTIGKLPVKLPTLSDKTYNAQPQTADVPASNWYSVKENAGGTDCGRYNVVLALKDSLNCHWENSSGTDETVSFKITPKTLDASMAKLTPASGAYHANVHTPEISLSYNGYTLKNTDYDLGAWSGELVNAGTYTIKATGKANFTGELELSYSIEKAAPTADLFNITLPEKAVYDGISTFVATVTAKESAEGLGTFTIRYNEGVTPQAAGSYTVTAVVEEGTNYTAGEVSLGSFTVASADNAWTTEPSIEGWTYGETCRSLTMGAATFGTPAVRYVGTSNAGVSYDSDALPDQAGEYKAVFTVPATGNYGGLTREVPFTVKRAAGLKADDFVFTAPENLVYTGEMKTAGIAPNAGLTGVGAITQFVSPKAAIDVGTYTVAIDVAQGANYEASTGLTGPEWTFTIAKAQAPDVSIPIATIVYGQALEDAQFIDPTWKWVDDTIVPLVNGAYSAWLAVDDENYDYTGVAGYVDETDSITWDAWVSVSAATPAITITTDPGAPYYDSTVSVEAKAANPYNETFTDAPVPNLLYKIGDNPWAAFDGTLDLSAHTAPVGTVVSFKAVTVAEGRYAAAEKEITVTVVEKPQQAITCGEIVKTYGDKPFAMGAASNSGALSYSVSAGSDIISIDEEGTITVLNAGTAVITVTAAETAGYAQTSREFTVTVKPKSITAAPKAVSVAYSTDVPSLEIVYTGLVGNDSVAAKDFDLRLFDDKDQEIAPAEAIKKPGTYTIRWMNPDQVSFAELTNYVVTKVETANFVVFVPYVEEAPARKPAYVPPKIVEVPISGEEKTICVNATVKGSTATLEKVNDKQLHEVIGSHVETGTVTIDFSELKQKIDTVVLHTETIQQIAEAAHDAGNDTEALEIKLSNDVSVEFCAESLAQKVEQAQGKDITISIIPGYKDKSLSKEQKQAIGNRPSYSVIVTSGEERLTDLGGEMTIRAPYKLKYGEKPEGLVVYRVAEDGTREKCETSYDSEEKLISWKTDSLALFIIAYEAP